MTDMITWSGGGITGIDAFYIGHLIGDHPGCYAYTVRTEGDTFTALAAGVVLGFGYKTPDKAKEDCEDDALARGPGPLAVSCSDCGEIRLRGEVRGSHRCKLAHDTPLDAPRLRSPGFGAAAEVERDVIITFLRRRSRHMEKKAISGPLAERAGFLMHAATCEAVADMIARGEHLAATKQPKGKR